jgi:hypothetical protein
MPRGIKVGDPIFWVMGEDKPLAHGTVSKMKLKTQDGMSLLWVDGKHKEEDCIYADYCYPIKYEGEMMEVLKVRAALKKQYDDSMKLWYELNNKIVRETRDA